MPMPRVWDIVDLITYIEYLSYKFIFYPRTPDLEHDTPLTEVCL
jgi:hypothetical protein